MERGREGKGREGKGREGKGRDDQQHIVRGRGWRGEGKGREGRDDQQCIISNTLYPKNGNTHNSFPHHPQIKKNLHNILQVFLWLSACQTHVLSQEADRCSKPPHG